MLDKSYGNPNQYWHDPSMTRAVNFMKYCITKEIERDFIEGDKDGCDHEVGSLCSQLTTTPDILKEKPLPPEKIKKIADYINDLPKPALTQTRTIKD